MFIQTLFIFEGTFAELLLEAGCWRTEDGFCQEQARGQLIIKPASFLALVSYRIFVVFFEVVEDLMNWVRGDWAWLNSRSFCD